MLKPPKRLSNFGIPNCFDSKILFKNVETFDWLNLLLPKSRWLKKITAPGEPSLEATPVPKAQAARAVLAATMENQSLWLQCLAVTTATNLLGHEKLFRNPCFTLGGAELLEKFLFIGKFALLQMCNIVWAKARSCLRLNFEPFVVSD